MKHTTYSDLRNNLAAYMDQVNDDHAPLLVTRNGSKPIVMLSLEEFSAYDETAYLLASPENKKRLLSAVESVEQGTFEERSLLKE